MKKPLYVCLAVIAFVLNGFAADAAGSTHHGTKSLRSSESSEISKCDAKHFSGTAHWYGGHFHGRRTASGEVFDKHKLTCAHPSLPFGTHVKVHSVYTGKDVVVRVTDRCPRLSVRCIDLSEGAARKIGIYPTAPGKVKCEVLSAAEAKEYERKESHKELAESKESEVDAPSDNVAHPPLHESK